MAWLKREPIAPLTWLRAEETQAMKANEEQFDPPKRLNIADLNTRIAELEAELATMKIKATKANIALAKIPLASSIDLSVKNSMAAWRGHRKRHLEQDAKVTATARQLASEMTAPGS